MAHKIDARSLTIRPRQTIEGIPLYAKFLAADLDIRHNNCLLWTLQNDDKDDEKRESVEIIMLRIGQELEPPNAKYVGHFQSNSGPIHVFALRDSDKCPIKI